MAMIATTVFCAPAQLLGQDAPMDNSIKFSIHNKDLDQYLAGKSLHTLSINFFMYRNSEISISVAILK